MKFKKIIAMMAVILTLAASAPTVFATTESTGMISQTQIAVDNEDVKSEENILIETNLQTGEEKKVVVSPLKKQEREYYDPNLIEIDEKSNLLDETSSNPLAVGNDDLVLAQVYPLKGICYLSITFSGNDTRQATGFIVGTHTVVTSGHCLDHKELGKPIKVDVIPYKNGTNEPYGTFSTTKMAVPVKWSQGRNNQYDYGIITVNANIQEATGGNKLNYKAIKPDSMINKEQQVQGYPSGKAKIAQYTTTGKIVGINNGLLLLDKKTIPSMSGSPMFTPQSKGIRTATGILTGEYEAVGLTAIVPITEEIYDAISLYAK